MAVDLIVVATFLNSSEAGLAKSRLEAEGVKAFLEGEHTVTMDWALGTAVRWIKVLVSSEDLERAAEILNSPQSENGKMISNSVAIQPDANDPEEAVEDYDADEPYAPDEDQILTQREKNADRALRGAIIGIVWPLAIPFVFWTLLKIFVSNEELRSDKRRKAIIAALINIPMMILVCLFLSGFLNMLLREPW